MSVFPPLPPSREGFGARNETNIEINYELGIMNYKLFCKNMLKNTNSATSDKLRVTSYELLVKFRLIQIKNEGVNNKMRLKV